MSDLGSSFDPQIGPRAGQASGASFRRFAGSLRQSAGWKQWALLALPLLLVVPFIIAIIWFASSPNPLLKAPAKQKATNKLSSLLGAADSSKPKPAPGKPFEAPPRPSPSTLPIASAPSVQPNEPATDVPLPAQTIGGAVAPAPVMPNNPSAPVAPARAPFSPLVYRAKHDKVFGGSCSGQLTLNSGGLVFNCPDDPHGSVQIALSEIGAVDENGVRLLSGKKYHFSIPGMTKTGEEALFANWLHQVR